MSRVLVAAILCALVVTACAGHEEEVGGMTPPRLLSSWGLFEAPMAGMDPAPGVLPYSVNTELFSDHSQKSRFVRLPAGEAASYHPSAAFDFPVGAVLVKSFAYPEDPGQPDGPQRLIETRLLVRVEGGWRALPYVWNEGQTDAVLSLGGASKEVAMAEPDGTRHTLEYMVPNANMCAQCHTESGVMAPLGAKARHLNLELAHSEGVENQLEYWRRRGALEGGPHPDEVARTPPYDEPESGTIEERARGWLDINCAGCHSPDGKAGTSGMYLGMDVEDPLRLGVGKPPVAAGRGTGGHRFGIHPGHPERSILIHRILSTEAGVAMPEIGRQLVPHEAVTLLSEWIEAM